MGRLAQTLAITTGVWCKFQQLEMPAFGQCISLRTVEYQEGLACSLQPSSTRGSKAAMPVAGRRFAPACCAAQSVFQARRRSAVQMSTPAKLQKAGEPLNEVVGTRHRAAGAMQRSRLGAAPVASQPVLSRPARTGNKQRTPVSYVCLPGNPVARLTASESNSSQTRRLQIVAVLANHSVNRTHCGGPSFGL